MDITINARHSRVPESLRNQAAKRFERMKRIDARITNATLLFDHDSGLRRAEARLAVAAGPPLVAQGEGATFRTAMDTALSRLDRQLKRHRERNSARRSRETVRTKRPILTT